MTNIVQYCPVLFIIILFRLLQWRQKRSAYDWIQFFWPPKAKIKYTIYCADTIDFRPIAAFILAQKLFCVTKKKNLKNSSCGKKFGSTKTVLISASEQSQKKEKSTYINLFFLNWRKYSIFILMLKNVRVKKRWIMPHPGPFSQKIQSVYFVLFFNPSLCLARERFTKDDLLKATLSLWYWVWISSWGILSWILNSINVLTKWSQNILSTMHVVFLDAKMLVLNSLSCEEHIYCKI